MVGRAGSQSELGQGERFHNGLSNSCLDLDLEDQMEGGRFGQI